LTPDLGGGDPFTPVLRAYQGDNVQTRIIIGAHEETHVHSVNGIKWLQEPSEPKSGWRGAQVAGISEHFEFLSPLTETKAGAQGVIEDHLYRASSSVDGQWHGAWGLLRTYKNKQKDLLPLPNNADMGGTIGNPSAFSGICPRAAPVRQFDISAVTAAALPGGTLVYNPRVGSYASNPGPLTDPTALIFVNSSDLDKKSGLLMPGVPVEPLVLRANAGDCIKLQLTNLLPSAVPDRDGFSGLPALVINFNANQIKPSSTVGVHPQLLAYTLKSDDGMNVGRNPSQVASPGQKLTYNWYAGDLTRDPSNNNLIATPVEFGAVNLLPADTIKQPLKGLGAALIIEPQGATWTTDANTRTAATVTSGGTSFREFVVFAQSGVNLRDAHDNPICPVGGKAIGGPGARLGRTRVRTARPNPPPAPPAPALQSAICGGAEDAEDSGNMAINYRSEPMWFRFGFDPGAPFEFTRNYDFTNAVSNSLVGGDPATPVFTAKAGTPVRFRLVSPGSLNRAGVFQMHGHIWQREPYAAGSVASQSISNNPLSEYRGAQEGMGMNNHFDIVLQNGAGGAFKVPGDYLFRDQASFHMDGGRWGLLRVQP